jgi:hypothetical protein
MVKLYMHMNSLLTILSQDLHERFNKYGKEEWDY